MKTFLPWLKWAAGAACWLALAATTAAAGSGLRFGVFPSLSPRILVETYQPLAVALEASLGEPVGLETAPDFLAFHRRTVDGEYDLVLTAPHLAWLAWKEDGYLPILRYATPVRGVMIVRADSPYRQMSDLRGKIVAMPDLLAIVGIRMERMLEGAGLRKGRDFKTVNAGSHTNAAVHVREGQADAAVIGIQAFQQLPRELKKGMRIIAETPPMPGQVFLVHGRLGKARARAIAQAIETFTHGEAGKAFLQKGDFGGVIPLEKNELDRVKGDARKLTGQLRMQAPGGSGAR